MAISKNILKVDMIMMGLKECRILYGCQFSGIQKNVQNWKKTFSAVDVHFSGSKECYLTWFVNCKLNYCQFPMHISAWNWRINGGYGVYMNLLAAMRYGAAVHHQKP